MNEDIGPCTEWPGCRSHNGYGTVCRGFDGKKYNFRVHRMVYMFVYGYIPPGMYVLHKCDNPPCIRADHLFLGDHGDNMRDMAAKGRQARQWAVCPRCGSTDKNYEGRCYPCKLAYNKARYHAKKGK